MGGPPVVPVWGGGVPNAGSGDVGETLLRMRKRYKPSHIFHFLGVSADLPADRDAGC
jgi:hypothetical protein